MNLDGTGLENISQNEETDDYAAWHPDGRLAYIAEHKGRFDVVLVTVPE